MNKAPLQIYSSALIFAPEKSIVRELFDTSIPLWVTTQPIMQSNWDPCLATFKTRFERFGHGAKILSFPTSDRFLFLLGSEMEIWDMRTISCVAIYDGVLSSSVSFSPDGNDLFYLTWHETVQIISTATRSCVAEFRGHTDEITFAMFSSDGQQLASSSKDGTLKVWNRISGRCTATHPFNHGDEVIGFSPDGASFLVISNHRLHFLDSKATGRKLTYDCHSRKAVFCYNTQRLIAVGGNSTITFTDISTGITLTIDGVDDGSIPFVFLSSGQQLICPMESKVAGYRPIGIWNTMTATCETVLEGHRAMISDIILSSDEKRIASASYDKNIRVWDAQSGSCIATYTGHSETIDSIAYSSDGTLLISLDHQGSSKVWDTNSEIQPQVIESHGSAVLEVVLSPDKKKVVTTAGERTIKLWDTATGECITTGERHALFANVPLVVPHDILSAPYDHVVFFSDLYGWPRSIQFCQDSSKFVSTTGFFGSTCIKLWDTNTGGYELLYETEYGPAISIAISPNGSAVSSTLIEGTVMLLDTESRELLDFVGVETHDLSYSSFSPNGAYLMLGYKDGAIRLYHLSTRKWKEMEATHERPVTFITMSADGTRLASYDYEEVRIWATDTCASIAKYELASHASGISQLLFSPDNRYLISLYTTGKVKIEILCTLTGHIIAQLAMCGLANHMEFDSAGSSQLITNVGTLILDPPTFRKAKAIGIGLSNDGEWITWDSRNLLWLPPTFRISAADIDAAASLIALGTRLGRLLLIGVDASKIPPPTVALNVLDATNVP